MATDGQVQNQSHPLLTPALRLQILALLASEPQPKATMTYDEFLAWANEDTLAEWVDGRVVMASPAVAGDAYARALLNRLRRQGFLPAE